MCHIIVIHHCSPQLRSQYTKPNDKVKFLQVGRWSRSSYWHVYISIHHGIKHCLRNLGLLLQGHWHQLPSKTLLTFLLLVPLLNSTNKIVADYNMFWLTKSGRSSLCLNLRLIEPLSFFARLLDSFGSRSSIVLGSGTSPMNLRIIIQMSVAAYKNIIAYSNTCTHTEICTSNSLITHTHSLVCLAHVSSQAVTVWVVDGCKSEWRLPGSKLQQT